MLPFVNEPLGSIVHAKRMWLLASFVVKLWRSIEPILNGFGNLIFIVFQVYWCIFCSSLSQNTSTWLNPLWHHIVSPSLFGRASQACVSSCNLRVSGRYRGGWRGRAGADSKSSLICVWAQKSARREHSHGGLLLGFGEKMCEDSMIVRGEPVFSKVTMYRVNQHLMPNQICLIFQRCHLPGVRHSISLFEIAEL